LSIDTAATATSSARHFPRHGWIGAVLLATFWTLNWSLDGLRTTWCFFPLWLGYILTIDGLVFLRKGTSLATRNAKAFVGLFVASMPSWWLFEALNSRAHYWFYTARDRYSDVEFFLLASLAFSTVLPAVLGTSELIGTWRLPRWGFRVGSGRVSQVAFFVTGWLMLAALLAWPRYGAALMWMSLYLILEPLNAWLGRRTLLERTGVGDWRPVWALWLGGLVCGFFWEMWNFWSEPRWIYTVPIFDFWHVFEMPALGYLGYLPFALELFALYHLAIGRSARLRDYVELT
jgi:hypothetical protein